MNNLWKKLLGLWNEASPRKRWTWIALAFGIVCTVLFFVYSNSYQPVSITSTSSNQIDNPLYYFGVIVKTVGVLLLIVGGALILRRVQKKQKGVHPDRVLSTMESIRFSPKQAVHLVRVGKQYFLIGATDQNVNLISEIDFDQDHEIELSASPDGQVSFQSFLTDASEFGDEVKRTSH